MSNIETTNNKTRGIVLWDPVFDDAILTVEGSVEFPAGLVLARSELGDQTLVPYDNTGSDGAAVAIAVLTESFSAPAAGAYPIRALLGGRVRRADIFNVNGGALSQTAVDRLRDYSIHALGTTQLAELDNQ